MCAMTALILVLAVIPVPAFAYIDPNAGGLLFQILTPLLAVLGAGIVFAQRSRGGENLACANLASRKPRDERVIGRLKLRRESFAALDLDAANANAQPIGASRRLELRALCNRKTAWRPRRRWRQKVLRRHLTGRLRLRRHGRRYYPDKRDNDNPRHHHASSL